MLRWVGVGVGLVGDGRNQDLHVLALPSGQLARGALAIEALTQAARHAAFMVPAGLGIQEAAVVLLAQLFGVGPDVAFSLALVKRMREVVFGCFALLSWQGAELVRTRRYLRRGEAFAAAPGDGAASPQPARNGSRA